MKLWNFIKSALLQNPKQTICEKQAYMSYEELAVFAEVFARKISNEKCCAILCGSEMAASMALLGCFAAGVTAVPLSARYGEQHCKKILDMISPTAVITDADGELKVMHIDQAAYMQPTEHPALIMCTSGTTGTPKGAMLSEDNVLTNVSDICEYFHIKCSDKVLIARPLYHCAVLTGEFLTGILKGANIHFCSEAFNPQKLLRLIAEQKISVFCGTPTWLNMMAKFRRKNVDCTLRTICLSGECLSAVTGKYIAEAFPEAEIYHVYGLTEACPRVSFLPPGKFDEYPDSVGIPLNSVSVKILKDDGLEAGKNEAGMLWVRGGNVMMGYYNAPEQTAKVLKDGWLCTGDIGVIDSEGLLNIKGRSDDLIIRTGMNIYPQEIESTLRTDPRVRDVFAYGVDSVLAGMQIGIKISGDFADADEVRKLCVKLLPVFQVPAFVELVDEVPKSGSGKIIRGKIIRGGLNA